MQDPVRYTSLNQAYSSLIAHVLTNGQQVSPRGMGTTEVLSANFIISDPRSRILTSSVRKWSLPLAIGELCWHLRGRDDTAWLAYYATAWERFTDDGVTVPGSCYGKKLFAEAMSGQSVWDRLKSLLTNDPATRRAAVSFLRERDDLESSRDVSCVSSIQFFLREDKLHLFVNMRSNDLYLGLPYDVFLFSFLQELMSVELECELGEYHHYASSLHLYDRHLERAKALVGTGSKEGGTMEKLTSVRQIEAVLAAEESLRAGGHVERGGMDTYTRPLVRELERHRGQVTGRK